MVRFWLTRLAPGSLEAHTLSPHGWCAQAWMPPTTIPPPAICENTQPVTLMPLAPSPTPEAWALASLPIPSPTSPRSTNRSRTKEMFFAADTWTAAGICSQCGRAASNTGVWPPPGKFDRGPTRYPPVCWSANPSVFGSSQLVCENVSPLKTRSCAGWA